MQIFVLIHRLHRCSDFRPIVYPRGVIQTRIDATVAHSISEIVVPVRVVDVDVRKDVEIIFHVWQKIIVGIIRSIAPPIVHFRNLFCTVVFAIGVGWLRTPLEIKNVLAILPCS